MSYQTIVELLKKLREELSTSELDDNILSLLEQFDADIQSALKEGHEHKAETANPEIEIEETESLVDTAKRLETHFAAEHPVAETALREIINALAKMGI